MKMTPEQFQKLPKFAQAELSMLQEKSDRLEAEVAWLRDENRVKVASSNTVVAEGANSNTPLPNFSNIEFFLKQQEGKDPRWRSSITVRLRLDGSGIEINATDTISIDPSAGNHVFIKLRDR